MSLAIYGDSYGVKNHNSYQSWVDIITDKLKIEVTNYCVGASSLFYSYNQFLKTYTQYDQIIFLVTIPYRYTKPITLEATGKEYHICGINTTDFLIKKNEHSLSATDKSKLNSLKTWFWLMDDEFYEVTQKLIVEDIITRRPDAIIIPCFQKSLTQEQYEKFGLLNTDYLFRLVMLQASSLNLPFKYYNGHDENAEIMNAHFTPELNNIVSELVYNRIINKVWDKFPTEKIKHQFGLEKYFNTEI